MPSFGSSVFADWARLTRWRDWCSSKLPFISGLTVLLLAPATPVLRTLEIVVTVMAGAAFGYGLNDVTDLGCDARAGKTNRAAGLGSGSLALFLALTSGGTFALSLVWAPDAVAPALVLVGLGLAVAYSVPPMRLKERGSGALFGEAGAQWAVPVLAVAAAESGGLLRGAAWVFALLGMAIGVRWIAIHQLQDAVSDRGAGVRTYAAQGRDVHAVVRGAFACELVLLSIGLSLTWPRSIAPAVALALYALVGAHGAVRPRRLLARLVTYEHAPLAGYYFFAFPVAMAVERLIVRPRSPAVAVLLVALAVPHLLVTIRSTQRRLAAGAPPPRWPDRDARHAVADESSLAPSEGTARKRARASTQRPVVSASDPQPQGPP